MICPKCKKRMKCMETANNGVNTARRYKCLNCKIYKYTFEKECVPGYVTPLLSEKRAKYIKKS